MLPCGPVAGTQRRDAFPNETQRRPFAFPTLSVHPPFQGGAASASWAPPRHVTGAGARLPRSMPGGCAPPSRGLPRVGGRGWGLRGTREAPAVGAGTGGQTAGMKSTLPEPHPPLASPCGAPASARQRRAVRTALSSGRKDRCCCSVGRL